MNKVNPQRRQRVKATLAFAFFALMALGLLLTVLLKEQSFEGQISAILLLTGGFAVAGIGLMPSLWSKKPTPPAQSRLFWIFLALGLVMWVLAPIVAVADGMAWTDFIGSGSRSRRMPVWCLAIITWGTAIAVLVAAWKKARQRRRGK